MDFVVGLVRIQSADVSRVCESSPKGPNLSGLIAGLVISLTVLTAVSIGVITAYASVIAILHALAPQTSRFSVLVPSQTHASGD